MFLVSLSPRRGRERETETNINNTLETNDGRGKHQSSIH